MYNRNNHNGREVCKFFLQGRCKFGIHCKNEHPSDGGQNANRFAPLQGGDSRGRSAAGKYLRFKRRREVDLAHRVHFKLIHLITLITISNVTMESQGQASSLYGITADGIRLDLTDNSQKGERPQWEFSAYAPGVGAPRQLLEGQVEQSEEEMRVMCYLANATGQLQAYDQHVNGLRTEMNQQIQRILNDTEGAKRYVQEGEHQQPNRIILVVKSNRDFPWENKPGSQPQQGNPFGQASSTGSGFGQQKPAVSSGFGQASTLGRGSPFGKPSALGGGSSSAFGQAAGLGGVKPAFSQPAFGQASQPAATTFGQASHPTAASFGRPSQPATNAFGQASQQPATVAFGQASQPAASGFGQASQPAASAFGQPSQSAANPFGHATSQPVVSPFGQAPTQPAASPFGQPNRPAAIPFGQTPKPAANPFGQTTQPTAATTFGKPSPFGSATPAKPAFGGNPFGQQPARSAFGQASQPAAAFGQTTQPASGFGAAPNQTPPATDLGGQPAAGSAPQVNNSGMFQGHRLYKHDKNDSLLINVVKNGAERATRVWFVNGPPTTAAPDTEGELGAYEGDKGALLKEVYEQVRLSGEFPGGLMPECPPKREWVSFDL